MSELLQGLTNGLADVVEAVGASLVRVDARKRVPATGIVWSADGLIVTSHHVVQRDDNITVGLADGQTVAATLVGRDPTTDLAVLRVKAEGLTVPTWADYSGSTVRVGNLVLALGRPEKQVQAALGMITVLEDSWRTSGGGQIDRYLQADVVMYPGFSGGALVSLTGQILGLNTSALVQGSGVTLPTATVKRVTEMLVTHGHVQRGYLGISIQTVRLPDRLSTQSGYKTGLMLVEVEDNSPAAKGGLTLGDTVIALGNEPMRNYNDLLAFLNGTPIGTNVVAKALRGGEVKEFTVTVEAKSEK